MDYCKKEKQSEKIGNKKYPLISSEIDLPISEDKTKILLYLIEKNIELAIYRERLIKKI